MSSLARRVWPLRWIGLAARTRVLAGALRLANADEAGDIAEELMGIARARPDSTAVPALVSRWSALTARQRSELALIVGADWPMLLTYLGTDPDPLTRASVAAACGEVGGPAVMAAPTLVGFLADGDEGVAANAERSLGAFMRMLGERTLDGRAREAVLIAADGAIESFDRHRRSGALRAAIAHGLVAPGGVGGARGRGRWMSDPDHPAQMVVRGLIRTSEDPAMRSCAWVWLKHGSLATACAERLTQSDSLAEQSVVLERSHLALNRVRARGLSASGRVDEKRFTGALPRLSQFDGLSVGARRGLARWLETLPIGARLRDAASAVLLTDPDAQARQSLAISAARADRPPACLLDLVFDAEGAVASSAGDAVLSRAGADALPEGQRERLAAVLMRSGHESLRRLAEQVRQRAGGSVRARTSDDLER
ncbi:MAG: hypothetical protein K2Q09_10365, partial [Phycisphaerales bacterium]|nr:hypothetical protein [Phycisphaerales bacterium]